MQRTRQPDVEPVFSDEGSGIRLAAVILVGVYIALLTTSWISVMHAGDYGVTGFYRSPEILNGVFVKDVRFNSPAHRAGLQPGDVILALNNVAADNEVAFLEANTRLRTQDKTAVLRVQLSETSMVRLMTVPLQPRLAIQSVFADVAGLTVVSLLFIVIAVVAAMARPTDPAARLFFLGAGSLGISQTAAIWGGYGVHEHWVDYLEPWLFRVSVATALHLFLVFPEPHPVLLKIRRLGPTFLRSIGGGTFLLYLMPLGVALILKPHPEIDQPWWNVFLVFWLALALVALLDNSRRARRQVARTQARLILVSLSVALASFVLWEVLHILPRVGMLTAVALFPITVTVAILRYRLFDIDVVINRTLVYLILTGTLVLIYTVSVAVLQSTLGEMAGITSTLAVVVSTLAIAALFNPLRRRIQSTIDRAFYRSKYDAAQTLASFSVSLREDVYADLDYLTEQLAAVIDETMQPATIGIWYRSPEQD